MTLCEFKETIKRVTGSQKHVDSLLSNESYDMCLRVCRMYSKTEEVLIHITVWEETTEYFYFWNDVYTKLIRRIQ